MLCWESTVRDGNCWTGNRASVWATMRYPLRSICYAGKGRYVTAIVGREIEHLSEQQCVIHWEDLGLDDVWENVSVMVDVATLLQTLYTMILVNNQSDAQFFMYAYLYSLHVSGSHVPIIRRIIVSMRHLVYVTLCRWPSGMQEHMLLHTRRSSTKSDIKPRFFNQNN